jgi:hypothetical protein
MRLIAKPVVMAFRCVNYIKISNLNSRVHGNSGSRSSGHAISGSIGFGIGRSRNFSPLVNLTAGMLARVLYTYV